MWALAVVRLFTASRMFLCFGRDRCTTLLSAQHHAAASRAKFSRERRFVGDASVTPSIFAMAGALSMTFPGKASPGALWARRKSMRVGRCGCARDLSVTRNCRSCGGSEHEGIRGNRAWFSGDIH